MTDGPKLTLSAYVAFRLRAADEIEILPDPVRLGVQGRIVAPRFHQDVLAAFLTPRTVEEASATIGRPSDEVRELANRYRDLGLLSSERTAEESPGLRAFLREDIFADPLLYAELKREIGAGNACVIRDAFHDDFAERVWRALDRFEAWESLRIMKPPFFALSALGITDRETYPPELVECERILSAPATRALMTDLAGHPCDGELLFDPKLFLAGDYLSPHSDLHDNRAVSFVWSLAKGWQPNWGGHYLWCSPPVSISPTFNTLILYRATAAGIHMVTPVAAQARAKRFAISAWWVSHSPTGEAHPPTTDWYRGALRPLAPKVLAIG